MEFDLTHFPNAKAMVDKLHRLNTHAIISVWPSIGIESPMYKDKMNQGLLYAPLGSGNFRYVDAYNPMAMDVYCKYLYDNIYSLGFDGWWHDSTEPDVMNALKKESHLYEMKRMQPNYLGLLHAISIRMFWLCLIKVIKNGVSKAIKSVLVF